MTSQKTPLAPLLIALALSLLFALGMASLLNYYKFGNTLAGLARANVAVAAQDVRESLALSLSVGMDLSALEGMPALLARQTHVDPSIVAIRMGDMQGRGLYASDPEAARQPLPGAWLQAARAAKGEGWHLGGEGEMETVGWVLRNNFDLPVALLGIDYSTRQVAAGKEALFPVLLRVTLGTLAAALVLGAPLLFLLRRLTRRQEKLAFRASVLISLVTLAGLLTVSWLAIPLFERHLLPKLEQNARQSGQIEAELIQRAMAHGLALEELYGVDEVLRRDLAGNRGLASFAVLDAGGRTLFHETREGAEDERSILVPIAAGGSVRVGLDGAFAAGLVKEMSLDILVVLVVALCFTLEVLAFLPVAAGRSDDPLARSRDVRAPAFLFFLSEELSRPFLPGFVSSLSGQVDAGLQNIVIGLPIMVFMLVVAVSQPWLGALSQRFGNRRLLLGGALAAIAGFLLCAMATSIYLFILARMVCALGYAAIFVAAQGHILENTEESSRSAGFALFVGAIMVATICGPSIGGILADNIGARATFMVAAGVAALAVPLMLRLPGGRGRAQQEGGRRVRLADAFHLFRNRRFLALCVSAAIPAKILLTGCCFFLLPLYVISIGSTQTMAGRMLMVYAVFMVLMMPLAARYADRLNARSGFILAGLLISALGGLLALGVDGFWLGAGMVVALGLGQSLSITAQSTLVSRVAAREIQVLGDGYVYGVYRLLERLGNASGPLLAGVLLTLFGFRVTFVCMGLLALLAGAVFYWVIVRPGAGGAAEVAP